MEDDKVDDTVEEKVDDMLDDDEITPEEEAFMKGYDTTESVEEEEDEIDKEFE